jgi:16S rRNA G966 N2-methylase RsmD
MNRLLFGDNLKWLRDTKIFPDASVDLVYLDPPFNSNADYNASKLWHKKDYPKIQILTIEGLLDGTERVEAPPQDNPFAKAQREPKPEKQQEML